jgi:hypothetical protein
MDEDGFRLPGSSSLANEEKTTKLEGLVEMTTG